MLPRVERHVLPSPGAIHRSAHGRPDLERRAVVDDVVDVLFAVELHPTHEQRDVSAVQHAVVGHLPARLRVERASVEYNRRLVAEPREAGHGRVEFQPQ